MAAPRLPFLYPNLLRSVRSCQPTTYRSLRSSSGRRGQTGFHTTPLYHEQDPFPKRYGPAVEPKAQPSTPSAGDQTDVPPSQSSSEGVAAREIEDGEPERSAGATEPPQESSSPEHRQQKQQQGEGEHPAASNSPTNIAAESALAERASKDPSIVDAGSTPSAKSANTPRQQGEDLPIADHLRSMFEPTENPPEDSQSYPATESLSTDPENQGSPPPLTPPTYVHQFDSYTLVKSLSAGGFTEAQSVQIMKAIRGLLTDHLGIARRALYSKSDFENEAYLFRAACSELLNSSQASRNAEIQAQRSRRAQLQNEADILSQRFNQEQTGLHDNLKEMFNNQKMSTRELQRTQDTAIQELNYKIMVALHSDGRSQIEGLRWVLTRRAALAIATSAVMIIAALRYQTYQAQQRELEKKAAEELQDATD